MSLPWAFHARYMSLLAHTVCSFPLCEQPRRISHIEKAHSFALLTVRLEVLGDGEEREQGYVRLLDDTTLEPLATSSLHAL